MELLKFLLENYDVDGDNDITVLWKRIKQDFDRDDFVEIANILVLLDNVPKSLFQKFWDNM